jgi:tetratricopeptide (TPR) repeat protein
MPKHHFSLVYKKWIFCFSFVFGICSIYPAIPGWAVEQSKSACYIAHVASFRNSANAETFANKLENKGIKSWISKTTLSGKGEFNRVYIGNFETRESAQKYLQKLKNEHVISYFAVELKRADTQDKSSTESKSSATKKVLLKSETSKVEQAVAKNLTAALPERQNHKGNTGEKPLMSLRETAKTEKGTIGKDKSSAPPKVEGNSDIKILSDAKASETGRDYSFYYNKGIAYLIKEQYDLALQSFSNSIRINSKFAEAYIKRGDTWYLKGDNEMAINDYNVAISLKPDYSESYLGLGLAYRNLGQVKKSEENLRKACELKNEESCALLKAWAIILKPPQPVNSGAK